VCLIQINDDDDDDDNYFNIDVITRHLTTARLWCMYVFFCIFLILCITLHYIEIF